MKWPTNSGDDFVVDVTQQSEATATFIYEWYMNEREVANTKSKLLEVISGLQLGKFQSCEFRPNNFQIWNRGGTFPKDPKDGFGGHVLSIHAGWQGSWGDKRIFLETTPNWRFGRWFSFSIGWLIFQGVYTGNVYGDYGLVPWSSTSWIPLPKTNKHSPWKWSVGSEFRRSFPI